MERGSIMRARELAVLRKSLAKLTRTQRQRLVAELAAEERLSFPRNFVCQG